MHGKSHKAPSVFITLAFIGSIAGPLTALTSMAPNQVCSLYGCAASAPLRAFSKQSHVHGVVLSRSVVTARRFADGI